MKDKPSQIIDAEFKVVTPRTLSEEQQRVNRIVERVMMVYWIVGWGIAITVITLIRNWAKPYVWDWAGRTLDFLHIPQGF